MYQVRNQIDPLQVIITETSLTANGVYNQMQQSKFNWKGIDDDTIIEPS